jgi:alanine racemase
MKLIDLGALRTLEEHKFISGWHHLKTSEEIACQYLRKQVENFKYVYMENRYSPEKYLLLKSILAYAIHDLACDMSPQSLIDDDEIEIEIEFFKQVRLNGPGIERNLGFEVFKLKNEEKGEVELLVHFDGGVSRVGINRQTEAI